MTVSFFWSLLTRNKAMFEIGSLGKESAWQYRRHRASISGLGRSPGEGNGSPLQWKVKVKSLSRVRLCDPLDCSLPGSSVHGIFQARILEWVAIYFSRGSSRPMDRNQISHIVGRRFTIWATKIAWMYEPGGLQSIESQTIRHNWATEHCWEKCRGWTKSEIKSIMLSLFLLLQRSLLMIETD